MSVWLLVLGSGIAQNAWWLAALVVAGAYFFCDGGFGAFLCVSAGCAKVRPARPVAE